MQVFGVELGKWRGDMKKTGEHDKGTENNQCVKELSNLEETVLCNEWEKNNNTSEVLLPLPHQDHVILIRHQLKYK